MTIKLGSNHLSFAVQARLNDATAAVSSSSQRLSSGLRINKASDDAAGLAISSSLNLKSRIFTQGIRNLNDGLSAVNISESAIGSLSEILVQIEELSVQSMNGTYSDVQRQSMQQQVTALQSEWNRLVEGTTFNGQQLLTGFGTRMVLQGGDGTSGTLAVQVGKELFAGGFADYAGGTTLVHASTAGVQGLGNAYSPNLSADGRYVIFYSDAENLVSNDTNGSVVTYDVFVKDTLSGNITRVNTSSSGEQANGGAIGLPTPSISADGRYAVFQSCATNLVTGDTNGSEDIFLKDLLTGITSRVSTSNSGQQSNGASGSASISADGRYVVFTSEATNLVIDDPGSGVFRKDLLTGSTTRISATGELPAISADGRYVAFQSTASNLVSGDTNNSADIFVKDNATGNITRASTNNLGQQGDANSELASISADGRYVAFRSVSTNLVTGDTNNLPDIFVKDMRTGDTTRVSTSSSGQQSNGNSFNVNISADGRYLAFRSEASNLVYGDQNGYWDVFVKDLTTGATTRVSTSSSGAESEDPGYDTQLAISADGRYVAFSSCSSNLIPVDPNGCFDIFLRDLTKTGIQALAGMVVNNRASAAVTLNLVSKYKDELAEYKGKLGASTARIGSFISTLDSGRTNYVHAASRITDTDIAEESASLVAATTKQRVATALLAQAKLAPQIALELLRG